MRSFRQHEHAVATRRLDAAHRTDIGRSEVVVSTGERAEHRRLAIFPAIVADEVRRPEVGHIAPVRRRRRRLRASGKDDLDIGITAAHADADVINEEISGTFAAGTGCAKQSGLNDKRVTCTTIAVERPRVANLLPTGAGSETFIL